MKKIIRSLVLLLVIISLAGITTSCASFYESSHSPNLSSFKHKKPLEPKWILDTGPVKIVK